eukprot:tig00000459_g1115.t1
MDHLTFEALAESIAGAEVPVTGERAWKPKAIARDRADAGNTTAAARGTAARACSPGGRGCGGCGAGRGAEAVDLAAVQMAVLRRLHALGAGQSSGSARTAASPASAAQAVSTAACSCAAKAFADCDFEYDLALSTDTAAEPSLALDSTHEGVAIANEEGNKLIYG